jgi:hypothetical protein
MTNDRTKQLAPTEAFAADDESGSDHETSEDQQPSGRQDRQRDLAGGGAVTEDVIDEQRG